MTPLAISVPEGSGSGSPTATRRKFSLYGNRLLESDNSSVPSTSTSVGSPSASPLASPLASRRVHIVPFGYAYRHTCAPSDEPLSQLPPPPVPPRWDSLSNSSKFILQQRASSPASPFEPPPHPPSPFVYDAASTPSDSRNASPTFPLASKSSLANLRSFDNPSTPVQNFSRPRKQSIRQTITDAATLSALSALSGPRPPGYTYNPADQYLELNHQWCGIPAARPPLSYTNGGSASPGALVAPWMSGEELRSSLRSQFTESTAPGTVVTAQSSVLTKDSSVTSLYPSPEGNAEPEAEADNELDPDLDEPSLEDVMGIFIEATEDEDFPQHPIPETAATLDVEIRMPKMIFTHPTFTSSVPHIAENFRRRSTDKRDFAKSLDSEPSINSQQLPSATEPASTRLPSQHPSHHLFPLPSQLPKPLNPNPRPPAGYTEYLAHRRKKWVAYLKNNALMTDHPNRFPAPNAKTKRFFYYAGGPAILAQHSGLYDELTSKRAGNVDAEAIERDLHRTFPDNIKFRPPGGVQAASSSTRESQTAMTDSTRSPSPAPLPNMHGEPPIITSLCRILHAFAVYNPRIGYYQSLNFLAGLLLFFVETEEQCFWLLNVITCIYLPGTHELSLEGSIIGLGVLMAELRNIMPNVWDKIGGELEADPNSRPSTSNSIRLTRSRHKELSHISTDRLPPIALCMTAWFMSCFISTLPIESTIRVWDVFFYEGSKTLFRIALAIFKLGESEVKAVSDPMEMFGVVQAMLRGLIDANALMEASFKHGFGHLSQGQIDERRQERRAKAQLERAR
ncbi:hypothetical protein B0J13DRAFT_664955 [Dactylonectria estremocensis]|uniref:Rab-GAP TBC domain-containing protein n=1 Tax=Dactylonectria estremocensis TaxID=1079267 RepID=A0A9P9EXE2_9HYPO|nr:hypothetical protein B0J13DRAFT_664955 [Dactylonectria estremocensis]